MHSNSDVECILTTILHHVLEYKNDIRTILKYFITRDLPCLREYGQLPKLRLFACFIWNTWTFPFLFSFFLRLNNWVHFLYFIIWMCTIDT